MWIAEHKQIRKSFGDIRLFITSRLECVTTVTAAIEKHHLRWSAPKIQLYKQHNRPSWSSNYCLAHLFCPVTILILVRLVFLSADFSICVGLFRYSAFWSCGKAKNHLCSLPTKAINSLSYFSPNTYTNSNIAGRTYT